MKKLKHILIAITLSLTLVNPALVIAQTTSSTINVTEYKGVQDSLTNFLCTPNEGAPDSHALEKCINKMYRFGISFGAIALVFFVVFAGYLYITGGESGKEKGKGILKNALLGMGLLLGSYVILSFINPNLVIIKPIQPPIFDAADLPECDDIGFEDTCVLPGGGVLQGGGVGGKAQSCPGGLVEIGSEIPTGGSANAKSQICKDLKDRLLILTKNTKASSSEWAKKWRITSSPMGPGHKSHCHSTGYPNSGTCTDIGFGPLEGTPAYNTGNRQPLSDSRKDRYIWLCGEVIKAGGMIVHNEAVVDGTSCGKWASESKASNWHLHIILMAPGSGGSGVSTTSSGSRPYCRPIYKFLCDHPANDSNKADDHVWASSFPEIQKNLNELKTVCGADKKPTQCLGYPIGQVYRSPEYGAHMRSIYEAYAILFKGWSDQKVASTGQGCDGSIQYVKSSDLTGITKTSTVGKYIETHFLASSGSGHFNGIDSPTTCFSDHGRGIALDFESATLGSPPSLVGPGKLCRNIKNDPKHYILYSKKKPSETCNN